MMDDPHKPSNARDDDASAQLLSALLDGELSGHERREVLERVLADPEEAERLAHYRAQRDALQALFPLPAAAPALFVQRREPRRRGIAYAFAGLAAGLLIGGGTGYAVGRSKPAEAGAAASPVPAGSSGSAPAASEPSSGAVLSARPGSGGGADLNSLIPYSSPPPTLILVLSSKLLSIFREMLTSMLRPVPFVWIAPCGPRLEVL